MKPHAASGIDEILSGLTRGGEGKLYKDIHKPIVLIFNKEGIPQEWKEYIFVGIPKKVRLIKTCLDELSKEGKNRNPCMISN